MQLNQLRDNFGAHQVRKRVGRGIGSGLGKTCGHGQKGQKARSGVAIKAFEGGQMPLQMRLPKRGFKRGFVNIKKFSVVNLGKIEAAILNNKINLETLITSEVLYSIGLLRNSKCNFRVLAKGVLTKKINIEAHYFSESAKKAINDLEGTIKILNQKVSKQVSIESNLNL